jgi:hypothetical protein
LIYLRLKNGPAAAEQFSNVIEHRGEAPASVLYPLAHLGLARASALAGDTVTARAAYEDTFKFWPEADPDLQPLKEARLEHARLP